MTHRVWLTDAQVGARFGSTRQWVWTQARTNPRFTQHEELTPYWSRWLLAEIEAFEREAMTAGD